MNPNVFYGPRIYAREETAMEDLARYAIRASFSQERMSYVEEDRIVLSTTGQRTARSRRSLTPWNGWSRLCRDGLTSPTRESRWSATMATRNSNVSRGNWNKQNQDGLIPCVLS